MSSGTEPTNPNAAEDHHVNRYSIRLENSLISHENDFAHDHQDDQETEPPKGCWGKFNKFYGNHQLGFIIVCATLGILLGVGLTYWQPEDPTAKETALLWIGLLGDLFLRALKCVILPLIFASIAISVMDMLALGKAGSVVGHTIGLYILTTVCAALIGVLSSLAFSTKYEPLEQDDGAVVAAEMRLACSVDGTGNPISFLTEMNDGSVMCAAGDPTDESLFLMQDVNGYFVPANEGSGITQLSISESLYEGLFMGLIGPNMVGLFYDNNFLGVIVLAGAFGVALSRLTANPPKGVKWDVILLIQILEELQTIMMMMIHWIIYVSPICILSLIATAIGGQSDMGTVLGTIGWLFASFMVGITAQFLFTYCGFYFLFKRSNPFDYFKHIVPAITLAFACASSAATLPVTLECVNKSGKVPPGIANFVLPLGATINMDGSAIWTINSCIALAYLNGITPTAADYIVLALISTLGTIGAAPVPSAGIVLTLTCYETTFGASASGAAPYGFGFIIAIDWLTDRFITMFNIMGDTVVAVLASTYVEGDFDLPVEVKADPRAQDDPKSPHKDEPEIEKEFDVHGKNTVLEHTYKIEDSAKDSLKSSVISA